MSNANMRVKKIVAGLVITLMASSNVFALETCQKTHSIWSKLVNPRTAARMLMHWEQLSNQTRWAKPTTSVKVEYVEKDASTLKMRVGEGASVGLLEQFSKDNLIKWYRHPLNSSPEVPFLEEAPQGSISAKYSASRSMFVMSGKDLYTFKLGTNRPHPNGQMQPGKADLLNDSDISMRRSAHIRSYDKFLPKAKSLYVLTEVISVATETNGFSVRDLRPLQDGHLYMPAFSVPYAGRKIAEKLGQNFTELWGEAFAKNLGIAKAELLMRYGMQMKTPNAQNWLIQLDRSFRPTGKIYMRDVADSNYVDFIAPYTGAQIQMIADKKSNYTIMTSLEPFWENSVWQMDEGGVTWQEGVQWGKAHDEAYVATICDYLNIVNSFRTIKELETYLKSENGKAALNTYLQRQRLSFSVRATG